MRERGMEVGGPQADVVVLPKKEIKLGRGLAHFS